MLDLLLLLMVFIWGANFSVIKVALREVPALAFNAVRLIVASGLFFGVMVWARHRSGTSLAVAPEDRRRIVALGVIGHLCYQLLFLFGVARTSVANASLVFGMTPITVALMAAVAGHDRVPLRSWAGAALSFLGLYLVVGRSAGLSVNSLSGDGLVFAAMLCWSLYSVGSQPLLARYSPAVLNGWTMAVGGSAYAVVAIPSLLATPWRSLSLTAWTMLGWSAVFALFLAYLLWYVGVQRIGSSRTSVYSNLTPVFAMLVAWAWLGEPVVLTQAVGAAAILGGIAVTRWRPRPSPVATEA